MKKKNTFYRKQQLRYHFEWFNAVMELGVLLTYRKPLDVNDVNFDFSKRCIPVNFPILWIENEKCKHNNSSLPSSTPKFFKYIYHRWQNTSNFHYT